MQATTDGWILVAYKQALAVHSISGRNLPHPFFQCRKGRVWCVDSSSSAHKSGLETVSISVALCEQTRMVRDSRDDLVDCTERVLLVRFLAIVLYGDQRKCTST
jgi:hypothetical protein